jgi:acetyl esterase/lipase
MRARVRVATAGTIAVTALAATGFASLGLAPPAQAAVFTNIAYAPAMPAGTAGHLLDLYIPNSGPTPRPLIIWSSGSAWMSDNGKSGADAIANVFNPRNYAVAGVSVRSSSQARFPAQVHDIKAAIRWLRANAAQFQLDTNRFAIMGNSSGGWVANMAGTTGGVAALEGTIGTTGFSSAVQASVPFFGPTDFLQMNAQRPNGQGLDHDAANSPESLLVGCAIQTCPATVAQANPITYVDQNDPPMLLLHGQADTLVPHGQSQILYNALRDRCRDTQFFSVPGAGHSTSDVMSPSRFGTQTVYTARNCQQTITTGSPNPTWDTIDAFLRRVLNITASPSPSRTVSPSPSVSPAANLLSNGNIESGTSGWAAFGAGTIAVNTSVVHGGANSLLRTGRTASWNGPAQDLTTRLTNGRSYTTRVWMRTRTGTPTGKVTLALTANGTTNYLTLAQGTVNTTAWTQLTGTATVSWTGTLTSARFYVETTAGTDNFYIDDATMQ